ncbi:MAG TPA: hypothetical protein VFP72_07570 [Kineosporiaceae bacterium]|nr:hypothetical protein [Kineosporiaceae bacterium]
MRLGRLVFAGLVGGAVAGFLIALLRPRSTHTAPGVIPLPGPDPEIPYTGLPSAPDELPLLPGQPGGLADQDQEPAVSASGPRRHSGGPDGAGAGD